MYNFYPHIYGLIIALSIFIALLLAEQRAKNNGYSPEMIWQISLWILPFSFVGARLYHVFDFWSYYSQNLLQVIAVWNGGLGIVGGLAGGLFGLFVVFYAFRGPTSYEVGPLRILDTAGPGIAFAQGLGRWANVLNGELLPYAYYESAVDFALFLLLLYITEVQPIRCLRPRLDLYGGTFLLYLIGYTAVRLALEPLHPASWQLGSINMPYVALPLVTIMYAVVMYLSNGRKKE